METSQMSINRQKDEGNVVYTCNGILFNLKIKENVTICCNVDGAGRCYAKWNKLVMEEQIPAWFLLYELSKAVKLIVAQNKIVVARGLREGEEGKLLLSGYKVTVTQDEKVLDICCEI